MTVCRSKKSLITSWREFSLHTRHISITNITVEFFTSLKKKKLVKKLYKAGICKYVLFGKFAISMFYGEDHELDELGRRWYIVLCLNWSSWIKVKCSFSILISVIQIHHVYWYIPCISMAHKCFWYIFLLNTTMVFCHIVGTNNIPVSACIVNTDYRLTPRNNIPLRCTFTLNQHGTLL